MTDHNAYVREKLHRSKNTLKAVLVSDRDRAAIWRLGLTLGICLATVALVSGCGGGSEQASVRGELIAFARFDGETLSTIYVMHADGTEQTRLTRSGDTKGGGEQSVDVQGAPSWSPDAEKIVYTRWGQSGGLWVMNGDGSEQRRLTRREEVGDFFGLPACDCDPAWSPDGKTIAFMSDRDDDLAIWVMNADGSAQRKLTNTPQDDASPTWSPDGKKIAFDREQVDGSTEIYVMNADGSGLRRLTRNAVHDSGPAWSPDGTKISFSHSEDEASETENSEIYVMNADGGGKRRLTHYPNEDSEPTWSPDGSMIAFVRGRGQDEPGGAIFVMSADGSSPRRLTSGGRDDTPAWQPGGGE